MTLPRAEVTGLIYSKMFYVKTEGRFEIVNITKEVEEIIRESGIKNGLCIVFLPHATATLILNEDEPNIREDYLRVVKELFVKEGYKHDIIDDNAHAHVTSAFTKPFLLLPVRDGRILRGTWQEIMLLELDGPRERKVFVEVIGE